MPSSLQMQGWNELVSYIPAPRTRDRTVTHQLSFLLHVFIFPTSPQNICCQAGADLLLLEEHSGDFITLVLGIFSDDRGDYT